MSAKLRNPLAGIPRDVLLQNVEDFANEKGLTEHLPALQKGAILAQHPHGYEEMPELTREEKDLIQREHTHRWSHPTMLYVTIFLCSVGAAVQGWDQTGSNGANLGFPQEFGIGSGSLADEWIVGVVRDLCILFDGMHSEILHIG